MPGTNFTHAPRFARLSLGRGTGWRVSATQHHLCFALRWGTARTPSSRRRLFRIDEPRGKSRRGCEGILLVFTRLDSDAGDNMSKLYKTPVRYPRRGRSRRPHSQLPQPARLRNTICWTQGGRRSGSLLRPSSSNMPRLVRRGYSIRDPARLHLGPPNPRLSHRCPRSGFRNTWSFWDMPKAPLPSLPP